jgi:hypothetical protein
VAVARLAEKDEEELDESEEEGTEETETPA